MVLESSFSAASDQLWRIGFGINFGKELCEQFSRVIIGIIIVE